MRFATYLAYFLHRSHPRFHAMAAVQPEPGDPRTHRGNLYVLIELMGESPVKGQVVRRLQEIVQGTYYTAGGPVSSILRQAIQEAHQALVEMNRRWPDTDLRAGITCAALVDEYLIAATAGPGLTLVATTNRVDQFPPDPSYYKGPIGGPTEPSIYIYRHRAHPGDVIFLGESDWLMLMDIRRLGGAVATADRENRFDVVDYLQQEAKSDQVLGMLIVLEEPEPERPIVVGRPVRSLPTALSAKPPIRDVPEDVVPDAPEDTVEPVPSPTFPSPPRTPPPESVPTRSPVWETPEDAATSPSPRPQDAPQHRARRRRRALGMPPWWLRVREALSTWWARLLPDRGKTKSAPAMTVDPASVAPRSDQTADDAEASQDAAAPPFEPPPRASGHRARLFLLLALLIPLLAFGAVAVTMLRQGDASAEQADQLINQAQAQIEMGEAHLDSGNPDAAWAAFNDAEKLLEAATGLVGVTERIAALRQRIAVATQRILRARRLYALNPPLIPRFPPDANPYRVLVADQNIFILDPGRQLVAYYRMDATRAAVAGQEVVVLRAGDNVAGTTVGSLVDMTWEPKQAGILDKASLLVLDDRNQVWRYNDVDGVSRVDVGLPEDGVTLQRATQIATYAGRLYLADEEADQIFRYDLVGNGYQTAAYPWFRPGVQVDLRGLLSMEIDSDIWLLMEAGQLLRYRQGEQQPFQLERLAALGVRYVDMALNTLPNGRIYLADANQDQVVVFDKTGAYLEVLQAPEAGLLRGLRGLDVDENSGYLFLLTQTSLFATPLAE